MTLQNQLDYYPALLNGVAVPSPLDADMVRSAIMLQCGLQTPLYSEPSTMAAAITHWFASRAWTFEHLIAILEAEYSPIENTDRYDQTTRTITRALDRTDTGSENETRGTESQIDTENEEINTVSAFNTSAWDNSSKRNSTGSTTGSEDVTGAKTLRNVADEDETTTDAFTQHMHGNIGVTSNQDMINQELDLLERFNVYEWIAKEFASDLMLHLW